MTLRVLTVRQPWATLLIVGIKPVENRVWGTHYRGDVAILASKGKPDTDERAISACRKMDGNKNISTAHLIYRINNFPRGGVLGVMTLTDVVTNMESWWFTGPKGLLLSNPRLCRTAEGRESLVRMSGALSMFTADQRDEEIIRTYLT